MAESRFENRSASAAGPVHWVEQEVLSFIASRPRGDSEHPAA